MNSVYEKYLHHLDGAKLSKQRKLEIIRIVYQIMQSQVEQAFGIHAVQLSCGKHDLTLSKGGLSSGFLERADAANDNAIEGRKSA